MENSSYSQNYTENMFPQNNSNSIESGSVSFIDWIRRITWPYWLLFFLILSFLGFNIFTAISKGAGETGSLLNTIIEKIKNTGKIVNTLKNLIFTSATGTKEVINSVATVSDDVLEKVQDSTQVVGAQVDGQTTKPSTVAPISVSSSQPQIQAQPDISQNNTLNRALNTSVQQSSIGNMNYQADDSLSAIQSGGSKGGWCLIGEDRGFRSCAQVENADQCMSGDIFPTNEICVNPTLRS